MSAASAQSTCEKRKSKTFAPALPAFHMSSRRRTTRLSAPMRMSVLMLRSWASSTTMTEYRVSRKSATISRRSTPSVMNLTTVVGDTVAS